MQLLIDLVSQGHKISVSKTNLSVFFFVQLLTNFVVTYFCGCRLDNLILEAITTLKEPTGSDRASIALYIQVLSLTCLSVITWGRNKKKSNCWTLLMFVSPDFWVFVFTHFFI
jgi:hypothetical protein